MKAAIAGGGIAGLAAGIALRNEGWEVAIYEKSPTMRPGPGNVFTMGANALRLLEHWGIDLEELNAGKFMQERVYAEPSGQLLKRLDHSWNKEVTGYDWRALPRSRLYSALVRLAQRTPEGKPQIKIFPGSAATGVDTKSGTLKTQHGETVSADVVIVADGIYSKLIYSIDSDAPPLQGTQTCFRMDVDKEGLYNDEVLGKLWENEQPGFVLFLPQIQDTVWLIPPESDGRLFSLLQHPFLEAKNGSNTRWDAEASMDELLELTKEFSGPAKRLVPHVRNLVRWTLSTRDPIATFARDKVVAIGDAAHPHVPSHGQGSASCMEDAASLAIFLSDSRMQTLPIEGRLQRWNEFRYGRASTIQSISYNGMRPLEHVIDKIRNRIGYKGPLPENVAYHGQTVQEFFFLYDVRKEAKAFIDREDKMSAQAGVERSEADTGNGNSSSSSP